MKKITLVFTLLLVFLSACQPAEIDPNDSLVASSTAAMKTVEALGTLLADQPEKTAIAQTSTPEPSKTFTLLPTNTLVPTDTPTPLPTPTTPWNSCDAAEYVSETIMDKAVIVPGTEFIKTWTLRNIGSCTWDKDYRLVFESGNAMTNSTSIGFVKEVVEPGESVTLSVKMTAPDVEGEHVGFWKLTNSQGLRFGLGGEGKAFYIQIIVAPETKDDFAVTSAIASTAPTQYKGICGKNGYTIYHIGRITTNKAGKVTYHWEGSNGFVDGTKRTIEFYGADTIMVMSTWAFYRGYHEGWVRLYIDFPNKQAFPKVRYDIVCTN